MQPEPTKVNFCVVGRTFEQLVPALKIRRKALGISQTELDEMIGVSRNSVNAWEQYRQTPLAVSLVAWVQALGLSLLVGVVDEDQGAEQGRNSTES